MDVFSSSYVNDCRDELLADDQCIFYLTENGFQCKYAVVKSYIL